MFLFSFLVVDELKEMLEEIEIAINTFKDEQRQMYVYVCFSYKNAFLTHNESFVSIKQPILFIFLFCCSMSIKTQTINTLTFQTGC